MSNLNIIEEKIGELRKLCEQSGISIMCIAIDGNETVYKSVTFHQLAKKYDCLISGLVDCRGGDVHADISH